MSSLEAYLATLPDGPRSFPECQVRHDAFDFVTRAFGSAAPDALLSLRRRWLPHGDPASGWVPDAYANCLALLFREAAFGDDDARCLAAFRRNNEALFERPLYRVVMRVLSPTLAIMGAQRRWSTFRRGSELTASHMRADGPGRRAARIALTYPPGLHTDFHLAMIATGIESAARAAGAREVQMPPHEASRPGHARWDLRYA